MTIPPQHHPGTVPAPSFDARPGVLVSVDVETAGPTPRRYPLLSIGACLVEAPERGFYVELKPDAPEIDERALAVGGLSLESLRESGAEPVQAMRAFEEWIAGAVPATHRPVFLGFNAAFDWMFVADAFDRYLGRNPFGHAAFDIKSFAAGRLGVDWNETSMRHLAPRFLGGSVLSHNALNDARDQARLFSAIMEA